MGDSQQKIGVPLLAVCLLLFAYWISGDVFITIVSTEISGFTLGLIGAFVGLVGVPLSWAGSTPSKAPESH